MRVLDEKYFFNFRKNTVISVIQKFTNFCKQEMRISKSQYTNSNIEVKQAIDPFKNVELKCQSAFLRQLFIDVLYKFKQYKKPKCKSQQIFTNKRHLCSQNPNLEPEYHQRLRSPVLIFLLPPRVNSILTFRSIYQFPLYFTSFKWNHVIHTFGLNIVKIPHSI